MKIYSIEVLLIFVCLIFLYSCKTNVFERKQKTSIELNYIPYYVKANEADSLLTINDYNGCFKILDSLFEIYEPKNSLNLYEYNSYIISSFKSNHLIDFKKKVAKIYSEFGGFIAGNNLKDSILSFAKLTPEDLIVLKQKYRNSLNDSLRMEVLRMANEDKYVRTVNYSEVEMEKLEKIHEMELDEIFRKHGFPCEKLIGSVTYFDYDSKEEIANLSGVLIHQSGNKNAKTKIIPILYNYLKKGSCNPYIYAMVYDKYEMVNFNKQYYNSFTTADVPIDTSLVNRKRNDSLRKSIGLPSIGYLQWKSKLLFGE